VLLCALVATLAPYAGGGPGVMARKAPVRFEFVQSPACREFQIGLSRVPMANGQV